jgi:carboxypeptidase Q
VRKIAALLLLVSLFSNPFNANAQAPAATRAERIDAEVYWKIRREGMERSEAMRTLHVLTDLYGPRLTGSPNFKAAADWTVKQMTTWGFKNAHLEAWDFGHPGWLNERLSAHITSPVKDALVCEALAWTPGTNGAVKGRAFQLVLPERPTKEALTAFLEGVREQVRGKIVLVGKHQIVPVTFNPQNKRREDAEVRNQFDPNNPTPAQPPFAAASPSPQASPTPAPVLTGAQVGEQLDQFLLASGVLVRVNDAGREHGQIRAFNNRTFDVSKVVPTVVMRNEDYGRISRILADGTPVELEFDIVNRDYPEGRTSYNVVGEISGTDKADEVVMLGGHLDSWHAATGATDNAIGCTIMLEAARILNTLGIKPRRTVRVALWSGEEQGLLGSKAYVKEHFGSFEQQKPEYAKFNGYFNIDSGTGRVRGATVFGPPETATVLRQALAPFEDLGVMGAISTTSRRTGGTDSTSFNEAGLPGIGFGQDPIEYGTHTWHTNLDTYERIVEGDVKDAAIVVAAAVYHLAMRDEMLPRFTKERMPAPPPTPTPSPSPTPTPARTPSPE